MPGFAGSEKLLRRNKFKKNCLTAKGYEFLKINKSFDLVPAIVELPRYEAKLG